MAAARQGRALPGSGFPGTGSEMVGVSFTLVTPYGLLFALTAVVPLVALAASTRRAQRVRAVLGLEPDSGGSPFLTAAAIVVLVGLLALALAQPVIRSRDTQTARQDAEAFYVFDISRSMLAAPGSGEPTRLDRARRFALRMRGRLSDVPSGVGTLTDRVLPNLFPTADEEVFTATVEQSVGVDRPTSRGMETVTTLFAAFDTMAGTNFFGERAKNRVVIVLTDGESAPFDTSLLREALGHGPPTEFVIVTFWDDDERVWFNGKPIPNYLPDTGYDSATRQLAAATDGRVLDESNLDRVVAATRDAVGRGETREVGTELRVVSLGGWLLILAVVPLAFLLWRRNLV